MSPCQEFEAARCVQLKFSPFLLVFIITISPVSAYGKEGGVQLVHSFLAVEIVKKLEQRGGKSGLQRLAVMAVVVGQLTWLVHWDTQ